MMVNAAEGAELICICGRREGRTRKLAQELECSWTLDYTSMLSDAEIEVIGIITPTGTHADFALKAIAAGKHVFVTKPMELSVTCCEQMIRAAESAGVILAVDHELRYSAENRAMALALRDGEFGKVILADLRVKWYRDQGYYESGSPASWRSMPRYEGGSASNQGSHGIDLFQWFAGSVKSVYGMSAALNHDIATEDTSVAVLELAEGGMGVIQTTTCHRPEAGTVMEFSCAEGSLSWTNGLVSYRGAYHGDAVPKNIVADMVSAVTHGTPVAVDGSEGKKTVAIFSAIYESARTGKRVELR